MRFASLLLAAVFLAASGTAMADSMSGASPKPSGSMHSMKSDHMKSNSMKSEHQKSNSMKSDHMMGSPKPKSTSRP